MSLRNAIQATVVVLALFIPFGQAAPAQSAAPYDSRKYFYFPGNYIQENINLNDSTSRNLIDRINDYQYQGLIIQAFKDLEDHYSERIRFEVQLAPGLLHRFQSDNPYRDSSFLFLSFKLNLNNPKIPQPQYIINKAHYLKNYLAGRDYAYRGEMLARAQAIEDEVAKYQKQVWWKRVSIGVSVPIYSTNTYSYFSWKSNRAAAFAGYDIGDICTIQMGASADRSLYASLGVDVSTPLYLLTERAVSTLANILGVRKASSYY